MRKWVGLLLTVAWIGVAAAQQTPGPVSSAEGPWRMQMHEVPLDVGGIRYLLQARVCRPPGEAAARVVVIAHGSPPDAGARPSMKPVSCDSEAARWFLDRGFVVIASMRRGYGATGGYWAEGAGKCPDVDYARAGLESTRDIAATVEYAATLPFVRPQGMVLVGQSAGGWGAVAYNATPHPRVTAIINMAGGRGGHQEFTANSNCRPDLLAAAAGQLARGSITPMLWVYSENDSFFGPSVAAAMYSAYTQNGGRAEMQRSGPFGSDGHRLFFGSGGSRIWGPMVDRYLVSRPGG
jgi:dienelactone hydrolase